MCICLRHFLSLCFLLSWAASQSAPAQTVGETGDFALTNAAQVRALTRAEAEKKVPIRVRGIVLECAQSKFTLIDGTVGLYVEGSPQLLKGMRRGDLVEVEGVSNPGGFAPYLEAKAVRILGTGTIPTPPHADLDALFSGRLDAQWIEVSGVVRHVERAAGKAWYLQVNLGPDGGRVLARADALEQSVTVDSTVRLRALCYYQFNQNHQAVRPFLSIPLGGLLISDLASTNLEAIPVCPIGSLLQFSVDRSYMHLVRVRGAVIYAQPGKWLWIRDAGHALRVACETKEPVKVGAEVDVFGFVKREDGGPVMEDSIFCETGKSQPVAPIGLTKATDAFDHDADLVECEAVIREIWQTADGVRLKLADGATEFPCVLRLAEGAASPKIWLPGAHVRVTGVCEVGSIDQRVKPGAGRLEPRFFQIILRSPADVVVLRLPSWWNAEHVAWVAGGVAATFLAIIGVVFWIGRHRLREQAAEQLKAETEFAAILNERNRMAREIHDTMSQGLSAISMQLEVVKRQLPKESKVRESLEVARSLARTNMTAARKAIWNVRSQDLEDGNLATALENVLRNLTEGTETKGELRMIGRMRRFAPVTENNLLRIGQEAVTNAAKYAQAKNILVTLDFGERHFRMCVKDDGKGFDVHAPPSSEGGLGLKAMRERAAQLHAEFSMTSEPQRGTVVRLVLPLPQ